MDFWSTDPKVLELKHKERIYPPRFQIQAYATRCVCTHISFQGAAEDIKTDLLLNPANSGIMVNLQYRYNYGITLLASDNNMSF